MYGRDTVSALSPREEEPSKSNLLVSAQTECSPIMIQWAVKTLNELNLAELICTNPRFVSQTAGRGSELSSQLHEAGGASRRK